MQDQLILLRSYLLMVNYCIFFSNIFKSFIFIFDLILVLFRLINYKNLPEYKQRNLIYCDSDIHKQARCDNNSKRL